MNRQRPVHLKKKVADTANQIADKAKVIAGRTQEGLEEFGDEFVANAARFADKISDAKDNLASNFKRNQNQDLDDHDEF